MSRNIHIIEGLHQAARIDPNQQSQILESIKFKVQLLRAYAASVLALSRFLDRIEP